MSLAIIGNGGALPLDAVPHLSYDLHDQISQALANGGHIAALFGQHINSHTTRVYVVLALRASHALGLACFDAGRSYASLTRVFPQAHWFEREILEQFGVVPEGHPWPKPIRFQQPLAAGTDIKPPPEIGVADFFRLEGEEAHEVAVGPVHAGIIEPGHFRFQCHGENVYHLEISLGYQHSGIERALTDGPAKRTLHYMETAAGDTSIGHALAYCQALEGLSASRVPARAQALRAVMLELERLANHTGDLGALANDIGYLPTANFCGRIRGDFLNMTALICGNRFGRNMLRPGGVRFDVDEARRVELLTRLEAAAKDVKVAVDLLWETPSIMARFEKTGALSLETCARIGLVGLAARACGAEMDVRSDFPTGWYEKKKPAPATSRSGDVLGRAWVRWLEIQNSLKLVKETLEELPATETSLPPGGLPAGRISVSLIEGWRGEICHVAITGKAGRFARYKIVDPSFHNWFGLALALRNQQISDFPLCNKSFNLSYCGHDL